MKKLFKKGISAVLVAVMAFTLASGVSALRYQVPEYASAMTARFAVIEDWPPIGGTQFSMISEDESLIIHISDDVLIYFEDLRMAREYLEEGQTLAELLNGRMLRILYGITTASIPAQTTPISIKIMFEAIQPLPVEFPLNGEIVVDGELIEAPEPFWISTETDYHLMLPVRAIAEALDYEVSWDAETRSVRLGNAILITIDSTELLVGRAAPFEMEVPTILVGSHTFVPVEFFRTATGVSVFSFEGQVLVETETDMF